MEKWPDLFILFPMDEGCGWFGLCRSSLGVWECGGERATWVVTNGVCFGVLGDVEKDGWDVLWLNFGSVEAYSP